MFALAGHVGTRRLYVVLLMTREVFVMCTAAHTLTQMWQSRVEIKGYSVAYFGRIVAFEAPYR